MKNQAIIMHKKLLGSIVIGIIISHYASITYALAPLGPPRALIGQRRWSLGLDIGKQNLDLTSSGQYQEGVWAVSTYIWNRKNTEFQIRNLESNYIYTTIGYGLLSNVDVCLLLGISNVIDDVYVSPYISSGVDPTNYFSGGEQFFIDTGYKYNWGISTRSTLYEYKDISLGAILQLTWNDPSSNNSTWTDPTDPAIYHNINLDLEFNEFQCAIGPTINLGRFWIYGGPFIHYVKGNLTINGQWYDLSSYGPLQAKHDIHKDTVLGGYIGIQWNMADNVYWHTEAQSTNNAWSISMGGLWRVE